MNRYPRNSAIRAAEAEGYRYTGATSRNRYDKEAVMEKAAKYRVMGNKVKVLLKRDVTEFRDVREIHSYWAVYVKYSEEYLAHQKAEKERHDRDRREMALRRMASECTLEEIQFMLNFKVNQLRTVAAAEAGSSLRDKAMDTKQEIIFTVATTQFLLVFEGDILKITDRNGQVVLNTFHIDQDALEMVADEIGMDLIKFGRCDTATDDELLHIFEDVYLCVKMLYTLRDFQIAREKKKNVDA